MKQVFAVYSICRDGSWQIEGACEAEEDANWLSEDLMKSYHIVYASYYQVDYKEKEV